MGFIAMITDFVGLGKKEKEVSEKQEGQLFSGLSGVNAFSEVNINYSDRIDLQKLKTIYSDETVRNAIDFLSFIIMKKVNLSGYYHEEEKIVQLVNDSIEHMSGSFQNSCKDLLSNSLFYGFGVAQTVFDVVNKRYLWGWTVNYNSSDLKFKVAKNDRNKEFISSVVINNKDYSAKNFIIHQHGDLSNVYGYGRGNLLEKYYDLKLLAIKLWAIALQKFTMPTIVGVTSNRGKEFLKELKKWVYNNIFIINPEERIDIVERKAGVNAFSDYAETVNFTNKMIYRTFFLPALLESGEQGGSYALGDVHYQLFDQACNEIAQELKDNVLLAQWVQRLIEYNFGVQKDYGDFRADESKGIEDRLKMADIFFKLVNVGVIDPVLDNEWIRKDLQFPAVKEQAVLSKANEVNG